MLARFVQTIGRRRGRVEGALLSAPSSSSSSLLSAPSLLTSALSSGPWSSSYTAFSATAAAAAHSRHASTSASSSSSPSSSSPSSSAALDRSAQAKRATEIRLSDIFYDSKLTLSDREKQVYAALGDEPALPLIEDHGHLYAIPGPKLESRPDVVKRAVSTRTANIQGMLSFKKSELLRKYAPKPFDTGSSRVQVAMLTERIERLAEHSAKNKHDKHCKRSLTELTVRRRKLLEYMMRTDYPNYRLMISELKLRPVPMFNSRHLPKVRAETHKQVKERHSRLKNRVSRGHKGH